MTDRTSGSHYDDELESRVFDAPDFARQWRASACDVGSSGEAGEWHHERDAAQKDALELLRNCDPPYDRVWIEYRYVGAPIEESEVVR